LGHPKRELRRHRLFAGLSDDELGELQLEVQERRVEPGDAVVREGESPDAFYVIRKGRVEVGKAGELQDQDHALAQLASGDSFGELALIDHSPRSATVRALEPTDLVEVAIPQPGDPRTESLGYLKMLRNVAEATAARLRGTNNVTVATLERELNLARTRVSMGEFLVFTILLMSAYGFVVRMAAGASESTVSTTVITVPVVLGLAAAVTWMMLRSDYPLATYGLTLDRWKEHAVQATLWTAPVLVALTALKWALISLVPAYASVPLFDFTAVINPETGRGGAMLALGLGLAYTVVVPFQELVARGALQSSLHEFLVGPRSTFWAILASNAMFTASHLYLSVTFALLAFPAGLFWGWIYARQRTLVGATFSHILVGLWVFSVLGVEGFLLA
jgi:CRP-like cAMP-binding protein